MKFNLIKKKIGIRELSNVISFDSDYDVRDICSCGKDGFLFSSGNFVGKIDQDNKIMFPYLGIERRDVSSKVVKGDKSQVELESPCSFCAIEKIGLVYMSENGGSLIRLLDLKAEYLYPLLDGVHADKYASFFENRDIDNFNSYVYSDGVETFWTVPSLNRIFACKDYILREVSGNGQAGFTTSNNITNCQFSSPQGIIVVNGNIFVADTGNNCIRVIGKHVELFSGFPLRKDFDAPSKLVEKSGSIFVQDKTGIKSIGINNPKQIIQVYESPNVVSMAVSDDRHLVILEKNG